LGFVYLDDKRILQAKETFARILAFSQKSSAAHFGLGMALAAEENYRAAVEEYQTAIKLGLSGRARITTWVFPFSS